MTRGFITLATGTEFYYYLAQNLLLSYRLYSKSPCPFAIMCDRENEYTAQFDDVVVLEKPLNSFWDKFELLKRSPYDETIFIDADCLAYADLNELWNYFADAPDFGCCGTNFPIDSDAGIFMADGLCEYTDRVHWKPHFCGGLYFVRKGSFCDLLYEECQKICSHYDDFKIAESVAYRADEAVLSIALAANGVHAMEEDCTNVGIGWLTTKKYHNILTGECSYETPWHPFVEHGKIMHFRTRNCKKPHYLIEIEKLNLMLHQGLTPGKDIFQQLSFRDKLLYQYDLKLYYMLSIEFFWRVVRKIKRILKIT